MIIIILFQLLMHLDDIAAVTRGLYDAKWVLKSVPFVRVDTSSSSRWWWRWRLKMTFLTNVGQHAFKLRNVTLQIRLYRTVTQSTSHHATPMSLFLSIKALLGWLAFNGTSAHFGATNCSCSGALRHTQSRRAAYRP